MKSLGRANGRGIHRRQRGLERGPSTESRRSESGIYLQTFVRITVGSPPLDTSQRLSSKWVTPGALKSMMSTLEKFPKAWLRRN
jgi:hypothetical protein